jgi:hypothetical protein
VGIRGRGVDPSEDALDRLLASDLRHARRLL